MSIPDAASRSNFQKVHSFYELTKDLIEKKQLTQLTRKETILLQKALTQNALHVQGGLDKRLEALGERMKALSVASPKVGILTKIMVLVHENLNPFRVTTETFKMHLRDAFKRPLLRGFPEFTDAQKNLILKQPEFWALDPLERDTFLDLFNKDLDTKPPNFATDHNILTAVELFGSSQRKAESKILEARLQISQLRNVDSVAKLKKLQEIQANAPIPPARLMREVNTLYKKIKSDETNLKASTAKDVESLHKMVVNLSAYATHKEVLPIYVRLLQLQRNMEKKLT